MPLIRTSMDSRKRSGENRVSASSSTAPELRGQLGVLE